MKRCVLVLLLVAGLANVIQAEEPLAPATIVVFNSALPESSQLAKFYAQKRGIARDHLVGLECSTEEEISREDYDRTIAEPLREIFKQRHWWTLRHTGEEEALVSASTVHFVALIKGMPLKIRAAENYPGDKKGEGPINGRNEASVDSELARLGRFDRTISGAVSNPYFQSYRRIIEAPETSLLLVCRLDAPAAATVRQMILDAIETEKTGLWGRAYIDSAHNTANGYEMGDQWLARTVEQLRKVGVPVVTEETPALFPAGYPISDCALYYGWYAPGIAGPFADPLFRFRPGAIAVHIHSFSASTLRDPNGAWAGPLAARGAAAVLGNVYEPYLQLTSHLDILNDRLLHGFTLAESAYMSMQALSWMSVVVGDPLYRPYASWLQIDLKDEGGKSDSNWRMYHDFAVENPSLPVPEYRTQARRAASRARNGPMIEDLGLMEAKDGKAASATSHFQQARALYSQRDDILRAVLEEAESWSKQGKPKRGAALLRETVRILPDGPTPELLKKTAADLDPASLARPSR